MLGRIFGPKREEVAGGWRRLYNEELHDLSASPNTNRVVKSRRMGWAEHIVCMGGHILVRKPEGKRIHRKCRWHDNI